MSFGGQRPTDDALGQLHRDRADMPRVGQRRPVVLLHLLSLGVGLQRAFESSLDRVVTLLKRALNPRDEVPADNHENKEEGRRANYRLDAAGTQLPKPAPLSDQPLGVARPAGAFQWLAASPPFRSSSSVDVGDD